MDNALPEFINNKVLASGDIAHKTHSPYEK